MCSIFYFQGGQMSGYPTYRELACRCKGWQLAESGFINRYLCRVNERTSRAMAKR